MYMYIIRLCIRHILEAQMRTYAADMRPTREGRNQASSSLPSHAHTPAMQERLGHNRTGQATQPG